MAGSIPIGEYRFVADREEAAALLREQTFASLFADCRQDLSPDREYRELLAGAVHIDSCGALDVVAALCDLRAGNAVGEPMESLVYQDPIISARVCRSADRLFLLISSAAVERLTPAELKFLVGRQLGHVAYEHYRIPVAELLARGGHVSPRQIMRLRAWQRKAAISSDRAGLLCCGSLEIAVTALFKCLSGLAGPEGGVDVERFERQFENLRNTLWQAQMDQLWSLPRPLSALRVRAMSLVWSVLGGDTPPSHDALLGCEEEITGLLAFMDPLGHRRDSRAEPRLLPFLVWGGLYVTASNGRIERPELEALADIVGDRHLMRALQHPSLKHYREQFLLALEKIDRPLSPADHKHLLACFAEVACADGQVDTAELGAIRDLAKRLGADPGTVEALLQCPDSTQTVSRPGDGPERV